MTRVGCCGFPEARQRYFRKFGLVEIQQTLLQVPQAKTAQRWRQEAPGDFEFTMLAWQLITHPPSSPSYQKVKDPLPPRKLRNYGGFQLTSEVLTAWERTAEFADVLGVKRIVFQCPPTFIPEKTHIDNLTKFFGSIERGRFRMVWEPRAPWPKDLAESLCRDLDLTYCVDPFVQHPLLDCPWYFKLRGRGDENRPHTDKEFRDLRKKTRTQEEVYVLFDTTDMLENAERFRKLVR